MNEQFTIKSRPNLQLRVGKLSMVELLAISNTMDLNDIQMTIKSMNFIFEHIEVELNAEWQPLKEHNADVYWPQDIQNDAIALQEIFNYFLSNVLRKTFLQSRTSATEQK